MAYPLQRNQQYTLTREDGLAYTWDPATGQYVNAKGRTFEQQNPNGLATYVPPAPAPQEGLKTVVIPGGGTPAPAAPDPYQSWLSKPSGQRSWRYIADDADKKFYEDNPTQAWQQFNSDQFGTRDTPEAQYAKSQYGRHYADYLRWSEGDPTGQRTWTDYQSNDLAGQIRQSFQLQSPTQKGYNLMWQPGGRVA